MSKIYLIFILIISQTYFSQNNSNSKNTNANNVQNIGGPKKNVNSGITQSTTVQYLRHDTCLNKKFSIVVYIFEDSIFSIASQSTSIINFTITPKIAYLNNLFKRICVSFEHCKTIIIPNYSYGFWSHIKAANVVMNNYFYENTINLYLPPEIKTSPCLSAYSFLPDSPSVVHPLNAVVDILSAGGSPDLAHAFGHFFGLRHTFDEINAFPANPPPNPTYAPNITSNEFVDGTNCKTHGDGICDTEADPYPQIGNYNEHRVMCNFNQNVKDGKGKFYTPPIDNYMSFYTSTCRCRFTQQQYNKMAETIITKRMYLH